MPDIRPPVPLSPMGVRPSGDGIAVRVHAPDAEAVVLCLFDDADRETHRLPLPTRIGSVWSGDFPAVATGTRYGLRAYGPWDPSRGLRFNPAKLLVDPWATALDRPFRLHPALFDHDGPNPQDTAPLMPKAILGQPETVAPAEGTLTRDTFDWDRQVVYELHVRGFSMTNPAVPAGIRGTYAGLGHPASVAHLLRLGVTTVEIMPSAAWADERHLPPLNLTDYWGYNPIAFLAPDPRLAPGGWPEVRAAVQALRDAGLAVILDAVLNHSAESDERGPTLSLRGLDNAGYYRLAEDRSLYVDDAGCGNVLALDRPPGLRLGMDALRAWAAYGGFDGFRLDLATTLGRGPNGFDPAGPFLAAIEQDPLLSRLAFVAEPWDIGMGGYQLGQFPARWGEWNDRYRDTVRRFWRGDPGMLGAFTTRFAGSADVFPHRPLTRSVNFVTAHDGFTLADLVAYETKRNAANGEANRDGTSDNQSWNNGVEGPTDDPAIQAARARDVRALLATLLLSRGTPMLTMGDEAGRTQHGNNNAYAQDNAGSWFDWDAADQALIDDTAALVALRKALAPLFTGAPLAAGDPASPYAAPVVTWRHADGSELTDWDQPDAHTLIADLRAGQTHALLAFHAGRDALKLVLPPAGDGLAWHPALGAVPGEAGPIVQGRSVAVFQAVPYETDKPGPGAADGAAREDRHPAAGVTDDELERLASLAGIEPAWWDVEGRRHIVPVETKRTLLAAMRLPAGTRTDWADSLARLDAEHAGPLPRMTLGRPREPIELTLGWPRPRWVTLRREDGSEDRYHADGPVLRLPPQPAGRHRLVADDAWDQVHHLTVAPARCYLPPALADGGTRYGIAAHLYSLRSAGDQGIGDFTTLARLAAEAAEAGAAVVGLNPLHAMFPHDRRRASPYHPSDRRFLDPVYIDVSHLPGGQGLPAIPGSADDGAVDYEAVDYQAVWARKRPVLQAALRTPAEVSPALHRFATFHAIAEVLGTSYWAQWPPALRHPDSPGVAAFAAEHAGLVGFHAAMQVLAEEQLAQAARSGGLSIGLYRDLAVGAAPDGAEAWAAQESLMQGVSVGAPPDPFARQGQVWSLPPPDPVALRRSGYAAFNELLEANMRHAGALRIDHAIGLRRLFVVPDGTPAKDGAYINLRLDEMLAQIALHSHRARCLVVGEDLGTVPEGLSDALAAADILSYSVLWFHQEHGRLKPQGAWKRQAAACVSTHDLPTVAGWWSGADVIERHALGMVADLAAALAERTADKMGMVAQLAQEGLLASTPDLDGPLPDDVAAAMHAFVAATPSLLALVQADDLAGDPVALNLPGTDRERPNWRRRLAPDVTALCHTPLARAILASMQARVEPGPPRGTVDRGTVDRDTVDSGTQAP
ncbi:MAG TPA: glycogen debranching protein GlgX [Rhodopila sp.]|uniref:glycogen debranching protein GlgX n=1 Tax=Rhodopila sp. TaxID=2480087 RepID=UPI002C23108E|nr:glycogen debranching protein GlgX [Rhodopila sp.]HVY13580.1 glycogen debranching protein GlgX [Rhodopila sp.]